MPDQIYDQDGNVYESHAHWIADKPITPDEPTNTSTPNLLDQAKSEYGILKNLDYSYKESFGKGDGFLEHWPPGETGTPERPRPEEFPIDKPGLEIFRKDTRPIDILGDITSHNLIETDPKVKGVYEDFQNSMQPWQKDILQNQYLYAKDHNGEKRSFEDWSKSSGIPAYFRGYAFKQWENPEGMYTQDQMKKFDSLNGYLKDPANSVLKASDSGILDMPENQSFVKAADFIGSLAPHGIKPETMRQSTNVEDHVASSRRFQDLHEALGDYMKARDDWEKNKKGPAPDIHSFMTPDDLAEYSDASSKALFGQKPGFFDGSLQNTSLAKEAGIDDLP